MQSILLIAGNSLREQRWLVLVLLAWVFGSSLVLGLDGDPRLGDAAFFLHQQAIYGVAFGTFLAASAIQNERRSRRILLVLSKGVERREYLAGLLFGVGAVEAIYVLAMALGAFWMLRETAVAFGPVGWLLLVLFLTAMLVAAVALFLNLSQPSVCPGCHGGNSGGSRGTGPDSGWRQSGLRACVSPDGLHHGRLSDGKPRTFLAAARAGDS